MKPVLYQPEIDGLRALAVLSVLFFHLDVTVFSGGYIGVDIFFVISGYLITLQIVSAVEQGHFNFSTFFIKRFRRIAPALFTVLLVSTIVAYYILLPFDFDRYSKALLSSLIFVSNVFFWSEAGYFDTAAKLKPLLHTWSLSVEMQFYLFWPVLVLLAIKICKRRYISILVLAGISSALATVIVSQYSPSSAFFLTPMRVFEFVVGASLIRTANMMPSAHHPLIANTAVLLGFLAIAYGVFALDGTVSLWGLSNLIPCLGAALLIFYRNAGLSGLLLGLKPLVFIGKISYSLYLVHWPLIAFYFHVRFSDYIGWKAILILIPVIFVLSVLLHYAVEKPMRYRKHVNGRHIDIRMLVCALLFTGMTATGIYAASNEGFASRYPVDVVRSVGDINEKNIVRMQHFDTDSPYASQAFDTNAFSRVLVVGDSHGIDLFNALHILLKDDASISIRKINFDDACFYALTENGTAEDDINHNQCLSTLATLKTSSLLPDATSVIVSSRWKATSIEYLPWFARMISEISSATIAITGRSAEFEHVPTFVYKNGLVNNPEKNLFARRDTSIDKINAALEAASVDLGLPFFDKLKHACELQRRKCKVVDDNGDILYLDYGHWSVEGAAYLGSKMLGDRVFKGFLYSR